jgi:hypothetical protein
MKTEQMKKETDWLQDSVLSDRDQYSRGHTTEDAFQFAKDWRAIRGNDREAALFLACELLKDAGLDRHVHLILSHWFGEDAESIIKLNEECVIS